MKGNDQIMVSRSSPADQREKIADGPGALCDEDLLCEYQRTQCERAFAELVSRYEHDLFNYLRRYLGDASMAEDVFQATFLQVHLKCDQFQQGRKLRPWLYTIATNQAIDALRKRLRTQVLSLDQQQPSEAGEASRLVDVLDSGQVPSSTLSGERELSGMARRAVDQLPEPLRNVVQLIYFQGLKYREAAQVLSIPLGTVKSRMQSAMARLGKQFQAVIEAERR